jgi:hypothetical protein
VRIDGKEAFGIFAGNAVSTIRGLGIAHRFGSDGWEQQGHPF